MAILLESCFDCILDRVIDLYDVRDYEIRNYQNSEYPKTDEEDLWYQLDPISYPFRLPIRRQILCDIDVHIARDPPIIHNHYVEQGEQ